MHQSAKHHARLFFETYCRELNDGHIVEIGSQDVNGSLREVAPNNFKYTGLDFVSGAGVDVVLADPYALPIESDSVDVVISSSCFEHSELFWLLFLEMVRILKPGGLIYLNAPSNGMIHRYPVDCWRLYPDSGTALCTWARRCGHEISLLESFIGRHHSANERWNDFVAVFVKGHNAAKDYPLRIIHATEQYYCAKVHGVDGFTNEQLYPEDQELCLRAEQECREQQERTVMLEKQVVSMHEELQNVTKIFQANFQKLEADLTKMASLVKELESRQASMRMQIANLSDKFSETSKALKWKAAFYKLKREIYRIAGNRKKVEKYNAKLRSSRQTPTTRDVAVRTIGILSTKHVLFIAHAIQDALYNAGFEAIIYTEIPKRGWDLGLYFVLCPQIFSSLPPGEKRIVFQLEQSVSSRWFTPQYFDKLESSLAVLDYSQANLAFLAKHGISYPHTYFVPLGCVERYDPYNVVRSAGDDLNSDENFDVLFYGDAKNERRLRLLRLISTHFRTKIASEVYGVELHRLIMRAKVVVNIHYYESSILETTRIHECLSLGVSVVSEEGSDMSEHEHLRNLVDFVPVGDDDALVAALQTAIERSGEVDRAAICATQDRFRFMFYRMLLGIKVIDFDRFGTLTSEIYRPSPKTCLSLPETTTRRLHFLQSRRMEVEVFDGIRYSPGWIGCALSYKYLCHQAKAIGLKRLVICEDDVEFCEGFQERLKSILDYLDLHDDEWDVFSGLIAHLHPDTVVESVSTAGRETMVHVNRLTSMVFNIYNTRAINLIADWNHDDQNASTNTIDRYLEKTGGIRVITTIPFLVGHHEDLDSSLWGFNNGQYRSMIAESESLLATKVAAFRVMKDQPVMAES